MNRRNAILAISRVAAAVGNRPCSCRRRRDRLATGHTDRRHRAQARALGRAEADRPTLRHLVPVLQSAKPEARKLLESQQGKGLEVLALSIDKNAAEVPGHMQQHGYTFNAAMMTPEWQRVLGDIKGLPVIWVIGRDSKVAGRSGRTARRRRRRTRPLAIIYGLAGFSPRRALAGVAELVDAADSKSAASDSVQVRVPPSAPSRRSRTSRKVYLFK